MRYYIASSLENVEQVRKLKKILDAAGWEHTYDWTIPGSVKGDQLQPTAMKEAEGVYMADVVIVLLPGGRGTHTELGIAIGVADAVVMPPGVSPSPRICIFSPDPEKDFDYTGKGTTSAFYWHPCVERFTDYDEMVGSLLGAL